ncbi:MAG: leucine-rich repeat protein [Lachnospiraceae bacterium]|nr:leucine-rich repeat protein [Lachnospiraceae bacterium]
MNEELLVLQLDESHGSVIKKREFAHYSALKIIDLPKEIEVIEDYAFYRCLALEEIHLYAGIKRLGCGAFMGCKKLKKIVIKDVEDDIYFLTEILYDFQYEVEVELYYKDGTLVKLTFPEYYEESVENTPARIIDIVFHGSGYKYRQCIRNRQMNFEKYDGLFSYAIAQEFTPTCIKIALNRLSTPVGLKETARERYLEYLREQSKEVAKQICKDDNLEILGVLAEAGYFREDLLREFQDKASAMGRAEMASYLLNYRMEHFKPKKKSFDFDDFEF